MNEIDQAVNEVFAQKRRRDETLSMLLREQREKSGHLLALSAPMGKTSQYKNISSYVTSVPLSWIADKVKFAQDLPLFKHKLDPKTGKIILDKDTISNIQQRQPDWRRQLPMALYLAGPRNHKFPPILVVAYQRWIYNREDPGWAADERALRDSLSVKALEEKGLYCDLDYDETQFYALDGQHRLMAILGLNTFLTEGKLSFKDIDGGVRSKPPISRDMLLEEVRLRTGQDPIQLDNYLTDLMSERIGIEIIPAVAKGETYDESRFRLRRIFVDVNEHAKPLTKGELIQLDEDDGFRIVARSVMVDHELLKKGEAVEQKKPSLPESSNHYTTLQALVEIARNYLGEQQRFSSWKKPIFAERSLGYWRPDEAELDAGATAFRDYLSALQRLESHLKFVQGAKASEMRQKDKEDNILFRPVAQIALAEAIGNLQREKSIALDAIVDELREQEALGQLMLRDPSTPWFGVLWDPANGVMRRNRRYQDLCYRLFRYLLGGGIEEESEREDLTEEFTSARQYGEDKAYDRDGNIVSPEKVKLPNPWR